MIERSLERFELYPERLIGDTAYGSAERLDWLVQERGIEPQIQGSTNPSAPTVLSRATTSPTTTPTDTYRCPVEKTLQHYWRRFAMPRTGIMKDNSMRCRASKRDCQSCPLKPRCCPRAPARKISRSIYEGVRDLAREIAKTEAYQTSRHLRISSAF